MADELEWTQLRLAAGDIPFVLLHHAVKIAPESFTRSEVPEIISTQDLVPHQIVSTPSNMKDIADRLSRARLLNLERRGNMILFSSRPETERIVTLLTLFKQSSRATRGARRQRVLTFESAADVGMAADLLRAIQSLRRGDRLEVAVARKR